MKRIYAVLMMLTCVLSACASQTEKTVSPDAAQTHVEGLIIVRTLNELLETYPFVLKGTCLEKQWDAEQSAFMAKIEVEKTYQGELSEKVIFYKSTYDAFPEGKRLFLFAQKWESVFTGEESFTGIPLVEGTQGYSSKYVDGIEGYNEQLLVQEIEQGMKTHSFSGQAVIGAYIHSDDVETIVKESPYVAEVLITSVREGLADDRDRADVLLVNALKGEMAGSFEVVVPKGSVKTGGRYILMLDKPSETSVFYIVSSRNSIHLYSAEEAERVMKGIKDRQ